MTYKDTKGEDNEPPQVTKITPANTSYINGQTALSFTAIDNVDVIKVEFCYSTDNGETWTLFKSQVGSPFTTDLDTTELSDGVIRVRAVAFDARDNASAPLTYAYSVDNTGPEKVVWDDPPYVSTSVTVTLSWLNVADDDIGFFRVQQKTADGSYTDVADIHSTLGANITNLTPDTEYAYRVIGYDRLGNAGIPSDDLVTRTAQDAGAPVISAITPRPDGGETSCYSSNVRVSASAKDDHAIKSITIQVSADQKNWVDVYTEEYSAGEPQRTASFTIDLTGYDEGAIYHRPHAPPPCQPAFRRRAGTAQ